MARLFADEDFPRPVVEQLRNLGHDVVTVQELNLHGTADPDVLKLSTGDGRTVLTKNRGSGEYFRLHRDLPTHGGIIVITQDADFIGQAGRIHTEIAASGDLTGKLIRVNRPQQPRATP